MADARHHSAHHEIADGNGGAEPRSRNGGNSITLRQAFDAAILVLWTITAFWAWDQNSRMREGELLNKEQNGRVMALEKTNDDLRDRLRKLELDHNSLAAGLQEVKPFASGDRQVLTTMAAQIARMENLVPQMGKLEQRWEETLATMRTLTDAVQPMASQLVALRTRLDDLETKLRQREAAPVAARPPNR